jgi:hypothetical protein
MQINRETFEAWLFAQPRKRQFNYLGVTYEEGVTPCLFCAFLGETNNDFYMASVGEAQDLTKKYIKYPDWALIMENEAKKANIVFYAGEMQDSYRRLFPSFDAIASNSPVTVENTKTATLQTK